MGLNSIDWLLIVLFLVLSLSIGLIYRRRGSGNMSDFFLGGRKLPWFVAGISMVATTFAADTPLAVTELVAKYGISGNWIWWNMLIGGMLTVFFFARLWRKANILTELEFIELRYDGQAARFLRGFKAIYLGLLINAAIIGWVNLALISLVKVFFDVPDQYLLWIVFASMSVALLYSALSGLWGVAVTDLVQFVIAMVACTVLAFFVVNSDAIGGIEGLKAKVPAQSLSFFPKIASGDGSSLYSFTISIGAFLAFIGVQWWASWYPGAEPGGGGYVAQRMMSCKTEKDSVFATLLFQVFHYCLRPWPWIIVALASVVLYPELSEDNFRLGYVYAMRDFLPSGLKGLLLVAFLAAYLSTISTQLNWGASYLINDFYKRFVLNKNNEKSDKHFVKMARIATFFIMIFALFITSRISSISGVWEFLLECGAGLGLVLILRWYWWRINAWSEITATIVPFIVFAVLRVFFEAENPDFFVYQKGTFFLTVGITTLAWVFVTFITKPVNKTKLFAFYQLVKPEGAWKAIRKNENMTRQKSKIPSMTINWLSSIVFTYAILFATGKIIFGLWGDALIWCAVAIFSLIIFLISTKKSRIFQ